MSATATLPPATGLLPDEAHERSVRRQVGVIWGLLVFNVIEVAKGQPTLVTFPHSIARVLTQGSLGVAALLALRVNQRLSFRPNAFLTFATLMGVAAFFTSLEVSTFHSDLRALRVVAFAGVLWLLTPFWGRRDFLLVRLHLVMISIVLGTVIVGFAASPHRSYVEHRLEDSLWPITATSVAHYAAVAAGLSAVLFLCGLLSRYKAAGLFVAGVAVLLLTHTRTATVGLGVGLFVAILSLVSWRPRARQLLVAGFIVVLVAGVAYRAPLERWFTRGENTTEFTNLTGRTKVWTVLESEPRTEPQIIFGFGLSNASFNGLPIDSSWLSTYEQSGLLGDVLDGAILLVLLLLALSRPRGPARAIALFLICYCAVASYTEDGLGYPSQYMLDLCVAASVLVPQVAYNLRDASRVVLRSGRKGRAELAPGPA